jgi:hypothetical protein
VAAEGQQPRLVALYEGLEGPVVAAPDQRHETLVGLQAQERRAACERGQARGMLKCGSFHGL